MRNDFYYNYEKDNSRHIAFDTKNKYGSDAFDSVNEIDINGEKFYFSIGGTKSGELKNGKLNGKFLLRLPTIQREISGSLDRQADYTTPKSSAYGLIKLIDTSAGKSRSIEFSRTLKDGDHVQQLFNIFHKLTLTNFDGKSIFKKLTMFTVFYL